MKAVSGEKPWQQPLCHTELLTLKDKYSSSTYYQLLHANLIQVKDVPSDMQSAGFRGETLSEGTQYGIDQMDQSWFYRINDEDSEPP